MTSFSLPDCCRYPWYRDYQMKETFAWQNLQLLLHQGCIIAISGIKIIK